MSASIKIPAKINLGLNVVGKRSDGYHELETVFYPVPLYDELYMEVLTEGHASSLYVEGMEIHGRTEDDLVMRAYSLLKEDYGLPPVRFRLKKKIPIQAGMGGGSADASYTLLLLNREFELNLDKTVLAGYAERLGADCPFFIYSTPCFATGIGEKIEVINLDLKGFGMVVIKPDVAISTKEAFSLITPRGVAKSCRETVMQPIETWRDDLRNDFETSAFALYPQLAEIKRQLYASGAVYAAMTGSGSAMFGIFRHPVEKVFLGGISGNYSKFFLSL